MFECINECIKQQTIYPCQVYLATIYVKSDNFLQNVIHFVKSKFVLGLAEV